MGFFSGYLYLWGGSAQDSNLYMLDFTENTWSVVTTTGSPPPPRKSFPYFMQDRYFYILPGVSSESSFTFSHGCFRIDLTTLVWETVTCQLNRVVFAYSTINGCVFLHGGITSDLEMTNEMITSEISVAMAFDSISPLWAYPKPRLGHTMHTSREYLWLFGGYSQGT